MQIGHFLRNLLAGGLRNWFAAIALCVVSFLSYNKAYAGEDMSQARPIVVIETSQGTIEVQLYSDIAPKTVENFLGLAEKHYYEGTIFHRVIAGFMIQGGDPRGNGTGGESLWGGCFQDEFAPGAQFDRPGLLAMANRGPNTNGSQFFITTALTPWLNQRHTIFGEVVKGYDVVQKIEKTRVGPQDRPLEPQKVLKVYLKK